MARSVDYRSMLGTEKAAAFMLSVGEDNAIKLFGAMEDNEIREISQAMSKLGTLNQEVVDKIFLEFVEKMASSGNMSGTFENTERLLKKAVGADKVGDLMEELRGPAGRTMWDKLANVNEMILANYLKNEYPQTIAVVLSKIRPDNASKVLSLLPDQIASEVLVRMLKMDSVQREVLEDVEKTLRQEFVSNLSSSSRQDSHELIAEILNNLDRSNESRFIGMLENADPDSAEQVRALMFTFEDLQRLEPQSVQVLIKEIEANVLGLALKGASAEMKNLFLSNMSTRAGKLLEEDMEAMGPVRMKAVEEAQTEIVNITKQMAASGEIVIAEDDEDDELVY